MPKGVFLAMVYERRSRLTPRQQGRLIEYFVAGATARAAAGLMGIQASTAIRIFMRLRMLIAPTCSSANTSARSPCSIVLSQRPPLPDWISALLEGRSGG